MLLWLSRMHQEVSQALTKLNIPHEIEPISDDDLFSFDILIDSPESGTKPPTVVEVDGQLHFSALQPYRPLGHTQIRNRLFNAAGHLGIAVAFFQWERLQGNPQAQAEYMSQRLAHFYANNAAA